MSWLNPNAKPFDPMAPVFVPGQWAQVKYEMFLDVQDKI